MAEERGCTDIQRPSRKMTPFDKTGQRLVKEA
jgi:hypothetical protein